MPKVTIQTDAQRDLLDALVTLRQGFLDAGVTVTKADVQNWLAGINAVTDLAKWRAYEKKASLLLIECMIAIARRLR
jgi:hypothetical protein